MSSSFISVDVLTRRVAPAALFVLRSPLITAPVLWEMLTPKLKARCYRWRLPCQGCRCAACTCPRWHFSAAWLPLQGVTPGRPARQPPSPLRPSADAVAFPSLLLFHRCVEKKGRLLVKHELGRRKSQSLGANCYSGFAVPSGNLLHHQPRPPLIWRVRGKSSTLKTQEPFCLWGRANNLLCSSLNTETGTRVCANLHLSLGFAEVRHYCGLRFGWAVALNSQCVRWRLLAPVPFLSKANKANDFHPLV